MAIPCGAILAKLRAYIAHGEVVVVLHDAEAWSGGAELFQGEVAGSELLYRESIECGVELEALFRATDEDKAGRDDPRRAASGWV